MQERHCSALNLVFCLVRSAYYGHTESAVQQYFEHGTSFERFCVGGWPPAARTTKATAEALSVSIRRAIA